MITDAVREELSKLREQSGVAYGKTKQGYLAQHLIGERRMLLPEEEYVLELDPSWSESDVAQSMFNLESGIVKRLKAMHRTGTVFVYVRDPDWSTVSDKFAVANIAACSV